MRSLYADSLAEERRWAVSDENVKTLSRANASFNSRDGDRALADLGHTPESEEP